MIRATLATLILTLASTASAQDGWQRGNWGGGGGNSPRQWLDRMLDGFDKELRFTEQQWAQIEAIKSAQETRAQEAGARWREVGEAMQAGDEARATELRNQLMQEFRESDGGMRPMLDDIETVLNPEQLTRFQEMRTVMRQWQEHGRQMWQAARELPDKMEMTEQQRESFQAMLRERWQAFQEEMRQRNDSGEGMSWEAPDFAALQDDFYASVGELLSDEQRKRLTDYRAQFTAVIQAAEQPPQDDVRTVLTAAKRVRDLSNEQRDALRDIERDALKSYGQVRKDKEQVAALAEEVKARIVKLLNPEQSGDFEQRLDRLRPRRERK
jgi:hypothetical protein